MFNSIHSQRWLKWICSPKKFIINLEIKVGDRYTFKDFEVVARFRNEAIEKAKQQAKDEIKIVVNGSKSLGKVKKFNEF